MTENSKENDELVSVVETLTKENDDLRKVQEEYEKLKSRLKEEEKAKVLGILMERTGKPKEEFEGKSLDVLKELVELLPEKKVEEKEKPKPKGVVEESLKEEVKEKEIFESDELGLTMTPEYWNEWNESIQKMADTSNVRWVTGGE